MVIRVACAALSRRIYAGHPNKKLDGFKGERFDVTSDCLKAVIEKIGPGYKETIEVDGKPTYEIEIREIKNE